MSKIFLTCIIILTFGTIGLFVLSITNTLPEPISNALRTLRGVAHVGPQSSKPYLEKFEGAWNITMAYSGPEDAAVCKTREGTINVHDGAAFGIIGTLGYTVTFTADINSQGGMQGKLQVEGAKGSITATLKDAVGSGVWQDTLECQGAVTLTKIDSVVDPVRGTLISFTGATTIVRSPGTETPYFGESLYAGDKIEVPVGATATLVLGTGFEQTLVPGGSTYTVQ